MKATIVAAIFGKKNLTSQWLVEATVAELRQLRRNNVAVPKLASRWQYISS